jgi:hypothetical protein
MNFHSPKPDYCHNSLTLHSLNVTHSAMSLLTLPPNLQQAITRLIPHHDLLSIRLTCQYFHGFLPDALLEKPLKWEDTEISLYFRSLLLLHGFSKTSRFRDAIIILAFLKPSGFRDEMAGKWHALGFFCGVKDTARLQGKIPGRKTDFTACIYTVYIVKLHYSYSIFILCLGK